MSLTDLRLYLMTWNVKGRPPVEDLHSALGLEDPVDVTSLPDLYAVGLQEVSLNIVSGMFFMEPWYEAVRNVLIKWNYIKLKHIRLQGILLMLFCKQEHLTHIQGVQTDLTRTGFGGVWGNKGGVSIRFSAYGCSMCIVNAHLAAHDEELRQRIEDYNSILDGQKFVDSQTENIITHDYVFWMGDLNFRIDDYAAKEIKQMVQDNSLNTLMEKDQLKRVMSTGEAFSEFTEPTPKFPPTYKFVVDAKEYDVEARKPAWTDRILYRLTPNVYDHVTLSLEQHHYCSHPQYVQSDHKPVTSSFTIKVFSEPKEHKVKFHIFGKWQVNRDSVAWYTAAQDVKLDAWDWIGLYRANFSSVDDHLCYVYASTKQYEKPLQTSSPDKQPSQEKQAPETCSPSRNPAQNTTAAPSESTFTSSITPSSVQALANSLVRSLTSSPSRSPGNRTPSTSNSPSRSPARSPALKRRQDEQSIAASVSTATPAASTTAPAASATTPATSATTPATSTTTLAASTTAPATSATTPATSATTPATSTTTPATSATTPATSATTPATSATTPATTPATSATTPATSATTPATSTTTPATSATTPAVSTMTVTPGTSVTTPATPAMVPAASATTSAASTSASTVTPVSSAETTAASYDAREVWYKVTFADTSLLVPGNYRLLYISNNFSNILGMSEPFQIHS